MTRDTIQKRLAKAIQQSPSRGKIRRISLFGSESRREARRNSDIDLLIEFSTPVGLFEFIHIENELAKELGKKVDLVEPDGLRTYVRSRVENDAVIVYETQ